MQAFRDGTTSPPAYERGFADGFAARSRKSALTAYLRVGIDDYAIGFRAGFYSTTGEAASADPYGRLARASA